MTHFPSPSGILVDTKAAATQGLIADGGVPGLQTRAEAARFAVLCRVAPMLRHDMAGALQPLGMIAMVLQRRVQADEPDLQAIAKNAASIGSVAKDAAAGCIDAISWLAPRDDPAVSWRSGVDEVLQVLSVELSACGLEPVNDIPIATTTAPQSYFRTVFASALLAFCDQGTECGALQIDVDRSQKNSGCEGASRLRLVLTSSGEPMTQARRPRPIGWHDVQALTVECGVAMARGDGWISVAVPDCAAASL